MNDNIKISVIIPVYNIENYLSRMIDSVLVQTFTDFEIILTDDGSIDNSGKICDDYAKKDNRINVIHQKNQGAHIARNNALKIAKGQYICFFDGDDYVENNTLKEMYEVAIQNDLDLVVSGFYIKTNYKKDKYIVTNYIPTSNNIYSNKKSFRENAYGNFDSNMFYPPWNKLYKKEYLDKNDITFPITYRDDFPFVMKVIKDIEKVGYTKKQYYHFFRERVESETQKFVKNLYDKREEEQKLMIDIYTYWGLIDDENAKDMLSRRYLDRLIECIVNLHNKNCDLSKIEKLNEIKKYLDNSYIEYCFKNAKPKKMYLSILYKILKTKNEKLVYSISNFIFNVKIKYIKLFTVLKKNR